MISDNIAPILATILIFVACLVVPIGLYSYVHKEEFDRDYYWQMEQEINEATRKEAKEIKRKIRIYVKEGFTRQEALELVREE